MKPRYSHYLKCIFILSVKNLSLFVTFQEDRNISELRDAILSVAALFLQLLKTVHELLAGQTGVNTPQLLVNLPPLKKRHHIITLYSVYFHHASASMTLYSHHVDTSSAVYSTMGNGSPLARRK